MQLLKYAAALDNIDSNFKHTALRCALISIPEIDPTEMKIY